MSAQPVTDTKPEENCDACGHPLRWHHAIPGASRRMCSEWMCKCDLPVRAA